MGSASLARPDPLPYWNFFMCMIKVVLLETVEML